MPAPAVFAHGGEDHSHDAAPAPLVGEAAQRLPDGSVFLPKPAQRQLAVRTVLAHLGEHARAIELAGRVIADPNAGGRIQASQSGRVEPGPKGLPALGNRVAKGEVVAYVRHIDDPAERAQQSAAVAELETQLMLATRRLSRLEQLEGSVPRKEIEAARLEVDGLKLRRNGLAAGIGAREALVAPVAGIISAADAVAGQVVEARDILFEVVDPRRVLIEAVTYDTAAAAGLGSASAVTARGESFTLAFVGGGRLMREQALPLMFRPQGEMPALAIGQPLKVIAATAARQRGVALPAAALTRAAGGETLAWIHASAERFVPRRVRAEPLDGSRVLVVEGLAEGDKLVVQGAAALAQVR